MLRRITKALLGAIVMTTLMVPLRIALAESPASTQVGGVLADTLTGLETFRSYIVGPGLSWLFWLGIGSVVGAIVSTKLRQLELTSRGELQGPSFRYLRWEILALRASIRWRSIRFLFADADADLIALNDILTRLHNLPPLPTTSFHDRDKLQQTDEYLRRVRPHFYAAHLDEARASAERYVALLRAPPA